MQMSVCEREQEGESKSKATVRERDKKGKRKRGKRKESLYFLRLRLLSSLYFTFFALLYYGKSKGPLKEGKRKAREKDSEPLLFSLNFTFFALLYFLRFYFITARARDP